MFKYRGTHAGVRRRGVSSGVERDGRNITVIAGRRPLNQLSVSKPSIRFLVRISRPDRVGPTIIASTNQFTVPKLPFTNICSLEKTKNKVSAVAALKTDLINNDIDVCVVSETPLKPEKLDVVVNIPNYTIFRGVGTGLVVMLGRKVV